MSVCYTEWALCTALRPAANRMGGWREASARNGWKGGQATVTDQRHTRQRDRRQTKATTKTMHLQVAQPTELMKFLMEQLPNKGRNKIKGYLTHRQVSVDGETVTKYDHPLVPGQRVDVHSERYDGNEKPFGMTILFEDEHILVIDKPARLLTIATDEEKERTAYHMLMDHVRKRNPNRRVFVVHRLDRDTSGVMLFAKSEAVKDHLQDTWKDSVTERAYAALVEGHVGRTEGTVTSWLKENSAMKMYSSRLPNDGLKAVTHYRLLQAGQQCSLLQVWLETGRKNQIRVHMQDIGHSVVGDKKYGAKGNPIGRLGLHAQVLQVIHPVTGQPMRFEAKLPKEFRAAMKADAEQEHGGAPKDTP